ncbi:hypothetical protein [Natrialba sp. SSL1]|uniref:hypothetical protein n=1 Tax=Natrialba sp. SSL1 TaxID=1869245 RepID=UPI0008F9347D|nr:hypothetical protein [Natrialba sp. SSL1]OIB57713.1 hypothetical protein BBD46_13080 [Natrialba sp. SSL1]
MNRVSRRRFLATSSVGLAAVAGCQNPLDRDAETSEISVGYSVTRPPETDAGEPGWILITRTEGAYTVTFDMRVCGSVEEVVATTSSEQEYTVDLSGELSDAETCQPERVLGTAEVPTETLQLSFRVTVNGEQLTVIERGGTTTSLHQIPDLLTEETSGE